MSSAAETVIAEILSTILQRPVAHDELIVRDNEEKWDSLKHIEIVFALESALGIELSEEEIGAIKSSSDLRTTAEAHLAT
jgi:acyl carrier protein